MDISKTFLAETKAKKLKATSYATIISVVRVPVVRAGPEGRLLRKLCKGVTSLPSPSVP